jgi:TonB-linked SusC/RagA family outer membrane protein
MRTKISFFIILLCWSTLWTALAQQQTLQGTVIDTDGRPLPGVNITLKGTFIGSVTDMDGKYSIEIDSPSDTLVFSFIGHFTKEFIAGLYETLDVQMEIESAEMKEVVITALGIKRDEKTLGYSVTEISGDDITQAQDPNFLNNLSGKVAGVQITSGGSGVGSSSRIIIRGESSLMGNNQPLFVVDGIPINNETYSVRSENNLETDYGNGASELNPDDIESISILKGANSTVLYGSRAANGVVLITTKSGKGKKGIGVSVNTGVTFETPLRIPKYQNLYGQGSTDSNGNPVFEFEDGSNGGTFDGIDESWGPRLDEGLITKQHDSPTTNGFRGGDTRVGNRGEIQPTPWISHSDNVRNFFETGVTSRINVAVQGGYEKGDFRLSYSNLDSKGILPNTDLKRNSVNLSTSWNLTEKLKIDAKANYIKSGSDNHPNNSYGTENIMYLWVWFGRQIAMPGLQDYWQPGFEDVQQFNYNYNWHDNPYFTMYENTNALNKNRVIGHVSATYEFTNWLKLMVRSGTDVFNDLHISKRAFSTQRFPYGQYREDKIYFEERNSDFLLSFNRPLSTKLTLSASFGGNNMRQTNNYLRVSANQLSVPGIYNFANTRVPLTNNQYNQGKIINSLYGSAQFGFNEFLFLDVAGRNDWSSTLPPEHNSYFYPSVSLSAVINDMINLPDVVSYAKVRTGWAQVGNDTDPFNLRNVFLNGTNLWDGNPILYGESDLKNSNLKPETSSSFEIGFDIRLFNNRFDLDFSYYNTDSRNQILNVPVVLSSGYSSFWYNAGLINSKGVEFMLNAIPIQSTNNGFKWDIGLSWSRDRSTVVELAPEFEINEYQISSNYLIVKAVEGGRMGDVYGTGFTEIDGKTLYQNGYHVRDNNLKKLGNYNPDWLLGINNGFTFKRFRFDALFDMRKGGVVMSRTLLIGGTSGMMEETIPGRDESTGGIPYYYDSGLGRNVTLPSHSSSSPNGETVFHDGIIGEGVMKDGDSYTTNDVPIPARSFYWSYYNRSNEESGIYDATYIKLREMRLSYTLPQSLIAKAGLQDITISLIGRNLFLWTDNPHFDPDVLSFNSATMVPGVEDMATPSSRSYGVNLSFKF